MGGTRRGRILVAGSANADFVVRAPHIPAPGETVIGGDLTIFPGGKGANQAVAAARAGNVDTAMVLALGDDDQARLLERSLAEAHVSLHLRRSKRATGAALITVSETGENAISVAAGANADLAPGDLPALDGVSWLVMQLETPIETIEAFARAAHIAGVKVLLNAAPACHLSGDLLNAVDLLVVNEEELVALVGAEGSLTEKLSRTARNTVVTLGSRGACAWSAGALTLQPAFAVEAVDTTAAGDTFCGVLAAALTSGMVLPSALERAAAAAALATTKPGAQSSIPTAAEVDAFMADAIAGDRTTLSLYCGASARSRDTETS